MDTSGQRLKRRTVEVADVGPDASVIALNADVPDVTIKC